MNYEKIFLSGLLTQFNQCLIFLDRVKPEYFFDQRLRKIYEAILETHKKGEVPSPISLSHKVDKNILLDIVADTVFKSDTEHSAKMIFEGYSKRFLELKCKRVLIGIDKGDKSLKELNELDNIKPDHFLDGGFKNIGEVMGETLQKMDRIKSGESKRMLTGCPFIDERTDGLEEGSLNIVAARPKNGKTSYVINLLHNFPGKAMFYSLEMNENEIGKKFISRNSRISVTDLKTKHCLQIREKDILNSAKNITDKKLWVDCNPIKTPSEVLSQCKYLKHTHGLDLIVIDYLQIMKLGRKTESKTVEIGSISNELKDVAKLLNVPIIALAQLGRGLENRTDKTPIMSDLRWAGELEQDAYKIIFLHVPGKYDDNEDPNKTVMILAANRSGEADIFASMYVDRATSYHRFYTDQDKSTFTQRKFTND